MPDRLESVETTHPSSSRHSNLSKLQALRDLYLVHKSVELDEYRDGSSELEGAGIMSEKTGLTYASRLHSGLAYCFRQYRVLFSEAKLKNAVLSTCVVALAQQLCGSK